VVSRKRKRFTLEQAAEQILEIFLCGITHQNT
jgi:hypothetical protein